MRLGFICPSVPGHLNPMTTLARHLQARNHDVVFLYSSGAGGLPCAAGPEKDQFDQVRPELSKLQGKEALKFALPRLLAQTERILKSLPAIVEANGVDALVLDTVQSYVELGAIRLGIPYVHVSAAVHRDYTGYTPLPQYGWPHQNTPEALARNREGVAKFVELLHSCNAGIKAYAGERRTKNRLGEPRFNSFSVGINYPGSRSLRL